MMDLVDIGFARLRPRAGKPFQGTSQAACRRYEDRNRGKFHNGGRPGEVIEMARDRKYLVAKDGSFRRIKAA